jgi:hypothetical protein
LPVRAIVGAALDPAVGKNLLTAIALRMRAVDWSQVGEPN